MNRTNRIIVNTIAQYVKTILCGIITLYSARLILQYLGVEDFGIYSLIAGVVAMLSFITNALSNTTQRFLSLYQGKQDDENVVRYLANSTYMHLALGVFLVILLLLLTRPIINYALVIPEERIHAATAVYIAVVVTLFFSFLSSPFKALTISHENIVFVSIVEFIDALLKLGIAIMLASINYDKLIFYGVMLALTQVVNLVLFVIYCIHKYGETRLIHHKWLAKEPIYELLGFAGWNVFNLGCTLGRMQGNAIIINRFVGTAANAAYGLGVQISSYLNYLSESILNAVRPQIIKAEGENDRERSFRLAFLSSKYSFILLACFSIPCIFEMPELLRIWLGEYPEYTVLLCRMFMISVMIDSLSIGLGIVNMSIGNLKEYALKINLLKFLSVFVAFCFMLLKDSVLVLAIVFIITEIICAFLRIVVMTKYSNTTVWEYLKEMIYRVALPFIINLAVVCAINFYIESGILRLLLAFLISCPSYLALCYVFSMAKEERDYVSRFISKKNIH